MSRKAKVEQIASGLPQKAEIEPLSADFVEKVEDFAGGGSDGLLRRL